MSLKRVHSIQESPYFRSAPNYCLRVLALEKNVGMSNGADPGADLGLGPYDWITLYVNGSDPLADRGVSHGVGPLLLSKCFGFWPLGLDNLIHRWGRPRGQPRGRPLIIV